MPRSNGTPKDRLRAHDLVKLSVDLGSGVPAHFPAPPVAVPARTVKEPHERLARIVRDLADAQAQLIQEMRALVQALGSKKEV